MSDVVRNWSSTAGQRKRPRRRRGFFHWIILLAVPIVLLWAWWASRDTYETASLVPKDQAYEIYLNDPIQQRLQLAESDLWQLLPPGTEYSDLRGQLRADIGVPEWVLKNFVPGACLITGNEIDTFEDALFVTRMTRIGCLIEKGRGFSSAVTVDPAGGLDLCYVPDADIWYATRGRVLLLSMSRDALIHALTLSAENARDHEALESGFAQARESLVFARMAWPETASGPGAWLSNVEGGINLSAAGAQFSGRVLPASKIRAASAGLLAQAEPVELRPALDGLVSVSADFGTKLGEIWPEIETAAGIPGALEELLKTIESLDGSTSPSLGAIAKDLLGASGPSLRLSWLGVDPLEMLPVPEVVLAASGDAALLHEQLAAIAVPPAGTAVHASLPRYDETQRLAYIPMIGGPSIEPSFGVWDGGLLFSTSRTQAVALLGAPSPGASPGMGNLYVEVHPAPIVDAVSEFGQELAVLGALRGHSGESFEASLAPWRSWAQLIRRMWFLAGHAGDGAIEISISVDIKSSRSYSAVF